MPARRAASDTGTPASDRNSVAGSTWEAAPVGPATNACRRGPSVRTRRGRVSAGEEEDEVAGRRRFIASAMMKPTRHTTAVTGPTMLITLRVGWGGGGEWVRACRGRPRVSASVCGGRYSCSVRSRLCGSSSCCGRHVAAATAAAAAAAGGPARRPTQVARGGSGATSPQRRVVGEGRERPCSRQHAAAAPVTLTCSPSSLCRFRGWWAQCCRPPRRPTRHWSP